MMKAKKKAKKAEHAWQPPATAPKDGTVFLGDMGWPWVSCVMWNGRDRWCYVIPHTAPFNGAEDHYFEQDWEPERALKKWMPMPAL